MLTFNEINTAIAEEMQLDPGLVSAAERRRFVNDGLKLFANLQILEKVYTQAGVATQYVDLPSDLEKIKVLYWNDGTNTRTLPSIYQSFDFSSHGTPQGYIQEGTQIRLYPYPSVSGSLRWVYSYRPDYFTVSNGSSFPSIPETWDTLLVDYGCYRSHRKNGNYLAATQYLSDFKSSLNDKIRAYISYLNSQVYSQVSEANTALSDDIFIPTDLRW